MLVRSEIETLERYVGHLAKGQDEAGNEIVIKEKKSTKQEKPKIVSREGKSSMKVVTKAMKTVQKNTKK